MRHLLLSVIFAVIPMSASTVALAHSGTAKTKQNQTFELPSQTEIEDMIDKLPDFNAIIADVIELTEDERLQKRMERSGEALSEKLEDSGALEPDENGIPNIKLALKVLASALSDEEISGGLLDTLSELQVLMDKHIPEDPKPETAE